MVALWKLLLEAQDSPAGVPRTFVEEKKEEMRKAREGDTHALDERDRRARLDDYKSNDRSGFRGGARGRGRGRGRGGFDDDRGDSESQSRKRRRRIASSSIESHQGEEEVVLKIEDVDMSVMAMLQDMKMKMERQAQTLDMLTRENNQV